MTSLQDYNNFHRIDIHKELIKSAFEEPGEGPACVLKVNHKAIEVKAEDGTIKFENGVEATADIIVAADGIRVCLILEEISDSSR
jgi:salicylate hydroxylase